VLAVSVGEYVLVATARGRRSDWFRNLEANPAVRYWLDGQEQEARAVPLGGQKKAADPLPEVVAAMASAMSAHAHLLGWRFAVLIPRTAAAPEV
jgi:hypothetical protein